MQHRGEIIKEAIYKSGYPITELAKRMGKSRRWVYLLFENPTVSIDIILQIGIIIHYNFSNEIEAIDWSKIEQKEILGQGASGIISKAILKDKQSKLLKIIILSHIFIPMHALLLFLL